MLGIKNWKAAAASLGTIALVLSGSVSSVALPASPEPAANPAPAAPLPAQFTDPSGNIPLSDYDGDYKLIGSPSTKPISGETYQFLNGIRGGNRGVTGDTGEKPIPSVDVGLQWQDMTTGKWSDIAHAVSDSKGKYSLGFPAMLDLDGQIQEYNFREDRIRMNSSVPEGYYLTYVDRMGNVGNSKSYWHYHHDDIRNEPQSDQVALTGSGLFYVGRDRGDYTPDNPRLMTDDAKQAAQLGFMPLYSATRMHKRSNDSDLVHVTTDINGEDAVNCKKDSIEFKGSVYYYYSGTTYIPESGADHRSMAPIPEAGVDVPVTYTATGTEGTAEYATSVAANGYIVIATGRTGGFSDDPAKLNNNQKATAWTRVRPDGTYHICLPSNAKAKDITSLQIYRPNSSFTGTVAGLDALQPVSRDYAMWSPWPKPDSMQLAKGCVPQPACTGIQADEIKNGQQVGKYTMLGSSTTSKMRSGNFMLRPINPMVTFSAGGEKVDNDNAAYIGDRLDVNLSNFAPGVDFNVTLNRIKPNTGQPERIGLNAVTAGKDGTVTTSFNLTAGSTGGYHEGYYWVDVLRPGMESMQQVITSNSFLYKPIKLKLTEDETVVDNADFSTVISQERPTATNLVKLSAVQTIAFAENRAEFKKITADSLIPGLTRNTTNKTNDTLEGAPTRSGIQEFWVKFIYEAPKTNGQGSDMYFGYQKLTLKIRPRLVSQDEADNKLTMYATAGQPYVGTVTVRQDPRPMTKGIVTLEGGQPVEKTPADGYFDLGHGLKLEVATGKVTSDGQPVPAGKVSFRAKIVDADGQESAENSYTIYFRDKLSLVRPTLPSVVAGNTYQNPNGDAVWVWAQGGVPKSIDKDSRGVYNVDVVASQESNFTSKGFAFSQMDAPTPLTKTQIDGGEINYSGPQTHLKISGTPNPADFPAPTKLYIPLVITDHEGRSLDGSKWEGNITNVNLQGDEGWVSLIVLPQIKKKDGVDLKIEGVRNTAIPPIRIDTLLDFGQPGSGEFSGYGPADYEYSSPDLPDGLYFSTDSDGNPVIKGTPTRTTPAAGQPFKIILKGKSGTVANRAQAEITGGTAVIQTDLKAKADSYNRTVTGGTAYSSTNTPVTASVDAGNGKGIFTGGQPRYSYKVSYTSKATGTQVDISKSGSGFPIKDEDGNDTGLSFDNNMNIVGTPFGNWTTELTVTVIDSDKVACTNGCTASKTFTLTATDDRKPAITTEKWIAGKGVTTVETVSVTGGSGKGIESYRYEVLNPQSGVTVVQTGNSNQFKVTVGHEVSVGNVANYIQVWAKDKNGNESPAKLIALEIKDKRKPTANSGPNTVKVEVEEGVNITDKNLKGMVDATKSPGIKCYYLTGTPNFTSCESLPEWMPTGIADIEYNTKTAALQGIPKNSTSNPILGDNALSFTVVGENGEVTEGVPAIITVVASKMEFSIDPSKVPAGETGKSYTWTFDGAKNGPSEKTYKLYKQDGTELTEADGVNISVDEVTGKVTVTANDAAILQTGGPFKVEVSAKEGDGPTIKKDALVNFEIVDPLKITNTTMPAAAALALFTDEDGSTYAFHVVGGKPSGVQGKPYTFTFPGYEENDPAAPDAQSSACPNGYEMKIKKSDNSYVDSGLCLHQDGTLTGTPAVGGVIDFSKLVVTDADGRIAKVQDGAKTLNVHEKLVITTPYYDRDHALKVTKNDTANQVLATVTGGAKPYKLLKVVESTTYLPDTNPNLTVVWEHPKGSGETDKNLNDHAGVNQDIKAQGKWEKIVPLSNTSYITISVQGKAGRIVSTKVFIEVETDLKFTDEPQGGGLDNTKVNLADNGQKPNTIPEEEWSKLPPNSIDPNLPVLGVAIDESDVNSGTGIEVPALVEGGEGPYTYRTEPCDRTQDNRDSNVDTKDCALGDTGLWLDSRTGEIYGTPNPGADLTAVVVVVDADVPPQEKRTNLVLHIPDNRKPQVTQTTFTAKVGETVTGVVAITEGSGVYTTCGKGEGAPSWVTVTPQTVTVNNKTVLSQCNISFNNPPVSEVTTGDPLAVKITVTDANGQAVDPAHETIKVNVVDKRKPKLADTPAPADLTEGDNNDDWSYQPRLDPDSTPVNSNNAWSATPLESWMQFDPNTGKVTVVPDGIPSGTTGEFPVTISVTGKNGEVTSKQVVFKVKASDLVFKAVTIGAGVSSSTNGEIATLQADKGKPAYTFSLVGVKKDGIADFDSNFSVTDAALSANTPEEGSYELELKVTDSAGVSRTQTVNLVVGAGIYVPSPKLPEYTGANSSCFTLNGGNGSYEIGSGVTATKTPTVASNGSFAPGTAETLDGVSVVENPPGSNIFCVNLDNKPAGNGIIEVSIPVTDGGGASETVTVKIPYSQSLQMESLGDVTVPRGQTPSGDWVNVPSKVKAPCTPNAEYTMCLPKTLSYTLEGAPEGVTINPETGVISGRPEKVGDGTYNAIVKVGDGTNTVSQTYSITVTADSNFDENGGNRNVGIGDDGSVTGNPKLDTHAPKKYAVVDETGTPIPTNPNGNYPIKDSSGNPTGLEMTPDGEIVGELKPGILKNGDTVTPRVVLTDPDDPNNTSDPKIVEFTISDTRLPSISDYTGHIRLSADRDITGKIPYSDPSADRTKVGANQQTTFQDLSCAKGTDVLPKPDTDDLTMDDKGNLTFKSPHGYYPGGTYTCTVTINGFNGKQATGQTFNIEVLDDRKPMLKDIQPGQDFLWEGQNVNLMSDDGAGFSVIDNWLETDLAKSPQLSKVEISGLPIGFATVDLANPGGRAAQCVDRDNPTQASTDPKKAVCTLTCEGLDQANPKCLITGWPKAGTAGGYVMSFKVTSVDNQETHLNQAITIYKSPLEVQTPAGLDIPVAVKGASYAPVAVRNLKYTKPADIGPDDWALRTPNPATDESKATWSGTYALDSGASYHVTGAAATHWKVEVADLTGSGVASDCRNGMSCVMKQLKIMPVSQTGAVTAPVGLSIIPVKVTDSHGIVRNFEVPITVNAPLKFMRPPFTGDANAVGTLPRGTLGAPYPAVFAEVEGGDKDYNTVYAEENATNIDYETYKQKISGYPGGHDPIFCGQQNYKKGEELPLTKPKCFPIPGLVPDLTGQGTSVNNRYIGEGVFLLTNGKIVGSVPETATAGDHKFRVVVTDGSKQIINKLVNLPVDSPFEVTAITDNLQTDPRDANAPNIIKPGMKNNVYPGSGEIAEISGGNAPYNSTCTLTPAVTGVKCVVDNGKVKLEAEDANTKVGEAFDGSILITVKDNNNREASVTIPWFVDTDIKFASYDPASEPGNQTPAEELPLVTVTGDQDNPGSKPTVTLVTPGNGEPIGGDVPINVEGGVDPNGEGLQYWLEDSEGNRVPPAPCPPDVSQDDIAAGVVCFPIGDTGLFLTSKGKVVGTPIPGRTADNIVVVADRDVPPRTKKANLKVANRDLRVPQLPSDSFTVHVGAGAGEIGVLDTAAARLDSPPPADNDNAWRNLDTKTNATAYHGQVLPQKPADWAGSETWDSTTCTATTQDWAEIQSDGKVVIKTGKTVPAFAGNPYQSEYTQTLCAYYVGENGIPSQAAPITLNIVDDRTVSDVEEHKTLTATAGEAKPETDAIVWKGIPVELVNADGFKLQQKQNPNSPFADVDSTNKIGPKGMNVSDLTCTPDPATAAAGTLVDCKITVSGTPTPAAAKPGAPNKFEYQLVLPNGQAIPASWGITIEQYDLSLVTGPMVRGIAGEEYPGGERPMKATGGTGDYWYQLTEKPENMNLSTKDNGDVIIVWTPPENVEKTYNFTLKVWDKTKCPGVAATDYTPGHGGPASCEYVDQETLPIEIVKRIQLGDLTLPPVTPGTSKGRDPNQAPLGPNDPKPSAPSDNPGIVVASPYQPTSVKIVSAPNGIPVQVNADNTIGYTVPEETLDGTYEIVVEVQVPGKPSFLRKINIVVQKPVPPAPPAPGGGDGDHDGTPSTPKVITNPTGEKVFRIQGQDRIGTALAVLNHYDNWSNTVILARDDIFADSLVAGPLAKVFMAPVLLTKTAEIQPRILDAIIKYGFNHVIIVGGEEAVSPAVWARLQSVGMRVEREGGADRYGTAVAVANRVIKERGVIKAPVFFATGHLFPDALSADFAAISHGGVVLLTSENGVDADTEIWSRTRATSRVAVGGPAKASTDIEQIPLDNAYVGKDRYATSVKVADTYFTRPATTVVATGEDFPDATVATAIATQVGAPLTLTRPEQLTKVTGNYLDINKTTVQQVAIVGGPAAVSNRVEAEIVQIVGRQNPGDVLGATQ